MDGALAWGQGADIGQVTEMEAKRAQVAHAIGGEGEVKTIFHSVSGISFDLGGFLQMDLKLGA